MYLLNTEPSTSLGCALNAVVHVLRGPVPQDAGTPLLLLLQIFNLSIILIAVLENVSPAHAVLQKRATVSLLIVGPARTGDRTCVAGSGASRSAIHYDFCWQATRLYKSQTWH
jgi:hypothetical protein